MALIQLTGAIRLNIENVLSVERHEVAEGVKYVLTLLNDREITVGEADLTPEGKRYLTRLQD